MTPSSDFKDTDMNQHTDFKAAALNFETGARSLWSNSD